MATTLVLSKNAINRAIMAYEVSWSAKTGFDTYNRQYARPVVPAPEKTDSGITVGIGYDAGMVSALTIRKDWTSVIPKNMVDALEKVAGLKKYNAVRALPIVKNVHIPVEAALQVFYNNTIYKYAGQALSIYPNLPNIHPVEQAVLTGLVYNRGKSLEGPRRKEMKELVKYIAQDDDKKMADTIRAMVRLWPDLRGLRDRRRLEAALVELPDLPIAEYDKLYLIV